MTFAGGEGDVQTIKGGSAANRYALLYATNTTWTVAEFSAANAAYKADKTAANKKVVTDMLDEMTSFTDGGSGVLFTADVSGMDTPLPIIDNLVFENGAVLDLLHNTDYSIKDLTGSPTVANAGEFRITNNWTICSADFPKADSSVRHPMTVAGKLVFAEGATFSIDVEASIRRSSAGIVVATATGGIVGSPRQAAGLAKQWKLEASGNNLVLRGASGFLLLVK